MVEQVLGIPEALDLIPSTKREEGNLKCSKRNKKRSFHEIRVGNSKINKFKILQLKKYSLEGAWRQERW